MFRVILARLDLYRMCTHHCMIVNQIVHLALLEVVVIEKFMSMCAKFLSHHILIDRTKIDAANIVKNWTDVVAIKQAGKQTHIIEIEFQ